MEWVRDTLPWPSAQQDQSKLYHLPPPTIGPHSTVSPPEEHTVKDTTPSSLDADPLVRSCCAGHRDEDLGGAAGGEEQGRASLSQLFFSVKSLTWGCRDVLCSWEEQRVRAGGTGKQAARRGTL